MGAMTRRRFLSGAGQIMGALALTSTGCGSGSPKADDPTRQIKVLVPPELAGTDKILYSASAAPSSLDSEGTGRTLSSNAGAQLLLLADSQGNARALTIALPGITLQPMDPASTAVALIFLTPGILSTQPDEAETRLNQISALPTITALRQTLEIALPSRTLADLQFDSEVNRLRAECAGEWIQSRHESGRLTRAWQNDAARFSVEFSGGDAIELISGAWRDSVFLRERLDSRNQQVPDAGGPVVAPMHGAHPHTWGALFSPVRFALARRNDRPEVDGSPPVGTIRYTVYGPGYAAAEPSAPAPVLNHDPYGPTFFSLGALPVIDLILGDRTLLNHGWGDARTVWESLASKPDISAARQSLRQKDILRAAEQLLPVISGYLAESGAIAARYGFAANPLLVPETADMIRMARFALSASTFLPAVQVWTSYPEITVYEMPVTSGEVVVK